ncbi:unnamed protein product [Phytophthora lilii]|uniref:Unnamed protein product n=1 Tax=Phytophthora lilii TaxID=2077276 RepID=A0A9W6WR00_9STRA|nr:unnamed protein product [Phytophthora lilii]
MASTRVNCGDADPGTSPDRKDDSAVFNSVNATSSTLELSFAADLLFNLDDVRADCASGLTAHGNLVTMLRNRVNLERTYAHELSKMAKYSRLDEMEHGSMKNALASLRAQYLNASVQHQQLAKNLEEDVLKPIEALYEYNSQKEQSLNRRISHIKKEAKVQEDAYRKDYSVFDKNFREASASFSAAMDSGFSSTLLEDQYHRRISQIEAGDSPAKVQSSTALTTRSDKSSGTVALKTINNHKLVSWLLSSENHRKEGVANNTVKLMEHVVFAASSLANEQVVAPKFEKVDVKSDIHDFIHSTRGNKDRVLLSAMTVNDLCNDTTRSLLASPSSKPCRPLRKTCLEIRDISSRKVPFDYDGNQELLCEVLSIPSRTLGTQYHQRQKVFDQGLSSSDDYARLRIDCHSTSSETKSVAGGETRPPSVESGDQLDVAIEDKNSLAQQCEPEHDSDEHTPNASPSASSSCLTTHFLSHDSETEFAAPQEQSTQVVKEEED